MPEAVVSAVKLGDLMQLQDFYQPDMPLQAIAQLAARHAQPKILEWCYAQGWVHPQESFNDQFFFAATHGASSAIFEVLVDHGWDLNAHWTEVGGDTLTSAILSDQYDFAKWLLEHGHVATPREGMYDPEYCLSSIVRGDSTSIEMLRLLLDHGIDAKDTGASIAAADEGNLEALRLLLDYGIDIEDRNMVGYPFDEDRDEPDESQGTALYRACRQGHLECVELLLDRGADAQAKDDGGTSCVEVAKKRGHEDVIGLLQERGVLV
jgi:ankyrin repeat protein